MRRPGFTFLELLIAVTLFSVGMVSVIQIFPINRRLLAQSALTTQGSFLAQEQMEKVRNTAYEDLTVGTFEVRAPVSNVAGDPFSQFERETIVSLIDSNRQPTVTDIGLKKIVVTVYWVERTINRQFTLTSYAYDQ